MPINQAIFSADFAHKKRTTRRKKFLGEIGHVALGAAVEAVIASVYLSGGFALIDSSRMLRVSFV